MDISIDLQPVLAAVQGRHLKGPLESGWSLGEFERDRHQGNPPDMEYHNSGNSSPRVGLRVVQGGVQIRGKTSFTN